MNNPLNAEPMDMKFVLKFIIPQVIWVHASQKSSYTALVQQQENQQETHYNS